MRDEKRSMLFRTGAAVAAIVAALAMALAAGAGPAAAGPADASAPTVTGWVVVNPSPDGLYETHAGSATLVRDATGATISCPLTDGWGHADSGTIRPQDWFASTGVTSYGGAGCTGAGGAGAEIFSSPDMVFAPETYDAGADRISGSAYAWTWGLFLYVPDCEVDLYLQDSNAATPLTYDNRTATLDAGPFALVVTRADGTGCADVAAVGDEMTYETTFVATPAFTVRPV